MHRLLAVGLPSLAAYGTVGAIQNVRGWKIATALGEKGERP